MQVMEQYPKPYAIFDEIIGLHVIRGPEVAGMKYLMTKD